MLKVLNKTVAIEPLPEDKTSGGIYIAEQVIRPHAEKARVIAISDNKEVNEEIKVGDIIFYYRFAGKGTETNIDGKDVKFISFLDIYCVVEPDEEIPTNS